MEGESKTDNVDSIILEEEIDPNYVPSEAEVVEYAKWLGMDLEKDQDLYWIAREGLKAPLPENWKPCKTKDTDDIYYFNFTTGESTWDHPCDGFYKRLYEEEKKKKEISIKENNDAKRSQAKQDVQQLLGKNEKKKKKVAALEPPGAKAEINLAPVLDRKPLPGIKPLGPLSSSFSGKIPGLEAKPVEDTSTSRSQTPLSNTGHNIAGADDSTPSTNILTMKSSSKLGMIGSLRAANESTGNLAPLIANSSNSVATNNLANNNESKSLERQKYRDEIKPIVAEERTMVSHSGDFATADAKEPVREVLMEKPNNTSIPSVSPPSMTKTTTIVGEYQSNNAVFDQFHQQERQSRAEIDRLTAENSRLTKKVDYLEQEVQSASRKSDQNAVYYNDRINTLDNDLLDAKKQVLSKDEEIFSLKNSVRNLETDLSRRQQLHNEALAVEQRKTQSLETQLLELQRLCFSKDDEIARLKLNFGNETTGQNNDANIEQHQQIISDLRSQLTNLQEKYSAQSKELREALTKPAPQVVNMVDDASLKKSKEDNQQLETEISILSQTNNRQQQQLTSVQQALQEKEAECDRLARQHQSQQSLFNEMMLKLEDAEKSKLFLTHGISEKEQELAVLRRKTDLMQEQQQQLQLQLQQQAQTIANLNSSSILSNDNNNKENDLIISQLRQQLQQQQERDLQLVTQHERDIASMRDKQDALKHEISLLQMNLSTAQNTLRLQTEDNEALRSSVTRLQDTLAQLEREKQEKDRSQMQMHSQCDGLKLEIQRLQSTASQLAHTQEMLRLKEDELSSVKTQLLDTLRQHQQQVSSVTSQVEASEVNLWRTKYETKTAEMRSKTEEISFLQGQLETAYNDLSAAQNNVRNFQAEAKKAQQEMEHLQHLLQSETDASNAKDKKIRGFREELLHLQKLLSDMEQSKRNSSNNAVAAVGNSVSTCDMASQTTQPYPEQTHIATPAAVVKKEMRDAGVQKNGVSVRNMGVSAVAQSQPIACQTLPVTVTDYGETKKAATYAMSVQTDPVTPEIREVIRTVNVPMSDHTTHNNNNSNEEMKLQMQYMREVREELGEKMQQCNQLLAAIASNKQITSSGSDNGLSKNETTTKPKVQIVRDTQNTPMRSDLLDSVSDVFSPPLVPRRDFTSSQKQAPFLERLTVAVSELMQGSLQYIARTHAFNATQSLVLVAAQSLLSEVVRPSITTCKSLVKEGRQAVQDMKRSYQEASQRTSQQPRALLKARESINILTNDLNLCIRLTRLLQDTEMTLSQACDTLQHQKGSRHNTRDKEVLQEVLRRTDAEVRSLRDTSLSILQQLSLNNNAFVNKNDSNHNKNVAYETTSNSHESSSGSLEEPFHAPYSSSDIESVSDFFSDQPFFNNNRNNSNNNAHQKNGRRGHRSVSPPRHNRPLSSRPSESHHSRSHSNRIHSRQKERDTARHITRSVSPTSYRHYSEQLLDTAVSGPSNTAMSAVVSRHTNYRDKLDSIQRQLSSAQQKQVDSLREYDRHYNWLGSLVREIGQQATAPVALRSSLDTTSAVRKTQRGSTPLATINPNILYDTGVASAKSNKVSDFNNVKPPQQFYL